MSNTPEENEGPVWASLQVSLIFWLYMAFIAGLLLGSCLGYDWPRGAR